MVGRVGQHGVEELRHGLIGAVHLVGEAVVELALLLVVQPCGQHALCHQVGIGVDMAHIAGIGVEFVDNGRHDHHVHRVVDARHADEGRVDGIGRLQVGGHAVGEDNVFVVRQVVEIGHLTVVAQGFAHGLAFFVVPRAALRATDESHGRNGQQGSAEENFFHCLPRFWFYFAGLRNPYAKLQAKGRMQKARNEIKFVNLPYGHPGIPRLLPLAADDGGEHAVR